jgi:hypothetical protein
MQMQPVFWLEILVVSLFLAGLTVVSLGFYPIIGDDIFQIYMPFYVYAGCWLLGSVVWLVLSPSKFVSSLFVLIALCCFALPLWTFVRFDGDRLRYNAARFNHPLALKTLLALSETKQTQLDQALADSTLGSNPAIVRYLLARGANPNSNPSGDETALMIASQRNSLEITQLLLLASAKVDSQDRDGMTALMWAAKTNAVGSAKVLIAAGANLDLKTKSGSSAIDIARQFNNREIEQAIIAVRPTTNAKS